MRILNVATIALSVMVTPVSSISWGLSHHNVTHVEGCALLENPTKYNGKLIRVNGLVGYDYEHFDLRFKCDGYVRLETSTRDTDKSKYGFLTEEDDMYHKLLKTLEEKETVGKDCLVCSSSTSATHVTIEGLFRCHEDFPDCHNLSRQGDSSIVIAAVRQVDTTPLAKAVATHE